jgi:hypothetical protein
MLTLNQHRLIEVETSENVDPFGAEKRIPVKKKAVRPI